MKTPYHMIIHYKDGEEKGHHTCPSDKIEDHIKFYESFGYTCEVYTLEDYEKEYDNFMLPRAKK